MESENQEVTPDASLIGPEKRKRGPSRKDPSERRSQKAHSQAAAAAARMPPRVDLINDPTQVMISQIVTGVVEATFDAGYLLAVRIGNSNITLRGAVFKPGQTAPVTTKNDVAPHVDMIKRTEFPFPAELHPKRRRRSKEKNMQLVTYAGNGGNKSNKGNYVLAPSVPPVGAPGKVVPVDLVFMLQCSRTANVSFVYGFIEKSNLVYVLKKKRLAC